MDGVVLAGGEERGGIEPSNDKEGITEHYRQARTPKVL